MKEKLRIIEKYKEKLSKIRSHAFKHNRVDKIMQTIASEASVEYQLNQNMTSQALEHDCLELSKRYSAHGKYHSDKESVLFYDGFGLDLRGWAASFARALAHMNKKIVYVTKEECCNKIPHVLRELQGGNTVIEYICTTKGYQRWANELNSVFAKHCPGTAFFYTTPYDVAGAVVFTAYKGLVKRIQVDLTDHAFWLGVKAIDILIESREVGASNAIYRRGIDRSKVKRLDCCLYINNDQDPEPLPFDIERDKYFFSGGSLYKTLGDSDNTYYKMVSQILDKEIETKFLYAGSGDSRMILELVDQYPQRAFYISERKDFYRIIKNCAFLLNTYPMFGGLMMRYAANAGVVPLTLRHNSDQDGILIDQDQREIQFNTVDEIVTEAQKLLNDEAYRKHKKDKLRGAVMSEEAFRNSLLRLIDEGETDYSFPELSRIDTSVFESEYLTRFDPVITIEDAIVQKMHKDLAVHFPGIFIKKTIRRLCS